MSKVAFITMDVESLYDTMCLQYIKAEEDKNFNCAKEVGKFINYLDEQNIKSTLFINLSFLPDILDDVIKAHENGHEIALHCMIHRDLSHMKNEDLSYMLDESRKMMRTFLKFDFNGFRFPCFHYKNEQIEVLKEAGFKYDSSALKMKDKTYHKINDVVYEKDGFFEFSPVGGRLFLKKSIISGGANLRLYPWGLVKKRLRKLFKELDSYLFYVHPFEISEDNFPKFKKLNIFEKLYLNRNRKIYFSRIKEIIEMLKEEGFEFQTMSNFINDYEGRNER